ncbi:PTS system mannose/fructose/sorbose family transporter subunit IID [Clostridium beijerinckii]|uniref:PTS mannose transporter subunit IID n=2 Tax=Clostridium TaxID=1485 RepID=A0A0B5QF23_CLOBE|nr:PTS mannose transporter subunit IID [Clostridium beijerinckii]AJH00900.1 PTS mannose transporter subunit IID [Clostridium beijerinckii]MBC2458867.1 PTS mannose transporter subunit IID [Clostridium beijerinckii]MBC2476293.1 PTS mannose transporter subunit IID [Clostridium beijerinckii]NOV61442.1 PTS system mannose-specific IID component [Clostridium beijerinckii]NOV69064.1 PTS system mannose-specific IID component [Clostridium beijerinckii]
MSEKKLNKSDIVKMFIRSNFLLGSFNFERMQAIGFCVTLIPALKKLYKGDELSAALKRHLEFFNTQPFMATPIMGITAAMEEQKANGADIDEGSISGVKIGLMGPLAGVGDPIFWGTLRPVLAALGAGLALTGSIIGPLIFFIGFNAIRLATNWYGMFYGYEKGTQLVADMGGNKLRYLTEGASVLGLLVIGGLVSKWTTVNIPFVLSKYTQADGKEVVTTIQSVLDSLMPGLVPLLLTFLCMYLLKKKVNPLVIIFGLFAVGILGVACGILQ